MRNPSVLLTSALLTASCTAPVTDSARAGAQSARDCFFASSVTGFSNAGTDRVLANIGTQETWELTVAPGCPDVDTAMRIGIVSRGSQRICTNRPAELVVPNISGQGSQRCLVTNIRRLSPEESAAARGQALHQ